MARQCDRVVELAQCDDSESDADGARAHVRALSRECARCALHSRNPFPQSHDLLSWPRTQGGTLNASTCTEVQHEAEAKSAIDERVARYFSGNFSSDVSQLDTGTPACGNSFRDECDSAYYPDCRCRYGDKQNYMGADNYCMFGECFHSDCAPSQVVSFGCAFAEQA